MSSTPIQSSTGEEPWALQELPPFPWITTKVLQLYAREGDDVEFARLNELLRSDTSVSAELLRRANSAAFGIRSRVLSVEHAVAMLGLSRVRSLMMTLGLGGYLRVALKIAVLRRCWRHSLGCALLAEDLAEAFDVRPDQGYTAALLHDLGRLALLVKYPQSYADLLSVVIENHFSLLQSERDLFDIDHCEAGTWLAEEYEFPPELVAAIRDHHDPADDAPPLTRLVHVACRMSELIGFEVVEPEDQVDIDELTRTMPRPVRLQPEDLEELKRRISDRVNALE